MPTTLRDYYGRMRTCTYPGCSKRHKGHGLCNGHLNQRRLGKELFPLHKVRDRSLSLLGYVESRCVPDGECLIWTGARTVGGYGQFSWVTNRPRLAHRLVYEEVNGPIPKGMVVRHTCDRTLCLRSEHLLVGTPKENTADMIARGRQVYPGAVLTLDQVKRIKSMLSSGTSRHEVADTVGIRVQHVGRIARGEIWRGVS